MSRKNRMRTMMLCSAVLSGTFLGSGLDLPGTILDTAMTALAEEAGDLLIDVNFDDGSNGTFSVYTNGGEFSLQNENGELICAITKTGKLDYANQAYYDGFSLTEGCEYVLSFDARCDIERVIECRIQLNGGDYHAYIADLPEIGSETKHIEIPFTMNEATDPAPRLAFNMGRQEGMPEDPGAYNIYLDNIQLVLTENSNAVSEDAEDEASQLAIDQVGYLPDDAKMVVTDESFAGKSFSVMEADSDTVVLEGTFGDAFHDDATDRDVCQGVFSELTVPGTYVVRSEDAVSYPFAVGEDVYDALWTETFKMITRQRCGMELDEVLAGDFAHPACHTGDAVVYGTDVMKEVSGGWHDAGDYGRYTVTGAQTIAQLLRTYEDSEEDSVCHSDELGIPESGNGVPDILDEVRYELEWLLKMQDENGGVYHKVTGANFPGTVMPQEETEQMILSPVSITATADFAAVMFMAAADWADIDEAFAEVCMDAGCDAVDFLLDTDLAEGFHNPSDIVTGEYPDDNYNDEMLWALCEMYVISELAEEDALELIPSIEECLNTGCAAGLGWMDMGAYGMFDMVTKTEAEETAGLRDKMRSILLDQANAYAELTAQDGYGCSLGMNYPWGSNMSVAANGMLMLMADELEDTSARRDAAKKQLDYLLGVNGMNFCYVSGFGSDCLSDPHHRPSQNKGSAMIGMLAGGPNMNLEDPYAQQVLAGSAPGLCYADNQQSYSLNEVAIYWNSPLVYLIAGVVS